MQTKTIPYKRKTVLDDLKKVITYPCQIEVIHMVPPRHALRDAPDREPRAHTWAVGTWAHQCDRYLEQALFLDVEPWYYPATQVKITTFTEDEYVKQVLGKGTMMNPKWDSMSFDERCKNPISVPATEEYIRKSFKEMQALTQNS